MLQRRLIRSLAATLAAMALLAPSAVAMPDFPVNPAGGGKSEQLAVETVQVPGPTVVVEADESSGFDWGSAAIGAGVAAAIVLLTGAAASVTVRHRRPTAG
jgi:hypothetical protein